MGYAHDNAASIRGVVMRVTRLGADGAPLVGGTRGCDSYITTGFIRFQFTPEYSDGDEIEVKNAAGEVCVYYKMPDTLKQASVTLELCDPDPVLTEMLAGGLVLTEDDSSACAPPGMGATDVVAVGYAAEQQGVQAVPNGVAIEVWASAIVGGKPANQCPYWHYVFPYCSVRLSGDRALENGALATVFEGRAVGNANFGIGPIIDTTGIVPAVDGEAFAWNFPQFTDRAYLYARSDAAPLGLQGCFANIDQVALDVTATADPANPAVAQATATSGS